MDFRGKMLHIEKWRRPFDLAISFDKGWKSIAELGREKEPTYT
jgi:hypothetical protein